MTRKQISISIWLASKIASQKLGTETVSDTLTRMLNLENEYRQFLIEQKEAEK